MKLGILISGLTEFLGGLLVFLYPVFILDSGIHTASIIKMYGILAVCFGIINILAFKSFDHTRFFRFLFLINMFFHMAIGFYTYGLFKEGIFENNYPSIFHIFIFVTLLIIYLKDGITEPIMQNQ